ncbi:MAG: winged helix-turn-helix domain-containing protein [Haloarculaceae archaeon]
MSLVSPDDGDAVDPIAVLSAVDAESRRNIVADVVGHPRGMPSGTEIRHMNPSLSPSTVSEHLSKLEDAGVIASVAPGRAGRSPSAPKRFYYLTEAARAVFDDNDLFGEEAYRAVYEQVEKPSEIREAQAAPRPAVDSDTVRLE